MPWFQVLIRGVEASLNIVYSSALHQAAKDEYERVQEEIALAEAAAEEAAREKEEQERKMKKLGRV